MEVMKLESSCCGDQSPNSGDTQTTPSSSISSSAAATATIAAPVPAPLPSSARPALQYQVVTVYADGSQDPVPLVQSYVPQIILSCFTLWCCCCICGLLAFILAGQYNKSSAVAEMGDRRYNRHGAKRGRGCCTPFAG